MEKGTFIKISYEGYTDGKLFDTTNEELAKENGIHNPKMVYGPVTIPAGEGMMLKGLDDVLAAMEVGEEKEVELTPENAFGKRDSSLVKIVPAKEFKKHNVQPIQGMPVNLDGKVGKIASVNGGRILVDFNHELAGKTVNYKVKIEEVVSEQEDVAKEVVKLFMPQLKAEELKAKVTKSTVTVTLPEKAAFIENVQMAKLGIANELMKRLEVEKVSLVDTFVKRKEEKE
ncbi:peptidylprolyl isomerase [Methanococcus voltae]|jgi:FKBP-type peptidyl-prolyl cis-trans isomerase SlyD|uniref:peptidylprolyl isomerase n=1 Tax=Methanococcus voltae (strain ATCC BAA-1334 / A3) TaxID=456320 RepID=D7DRN0_METV3|nr:peptidylprolyl isomerase [Methanococcus voltae]MCS3901107.1 FKBP-type peptidyl-prolyl cis-trans isomerase SlyD [Methanococcus voltae]